MAEYRKDIDGLRALAVAPVIMFHAGYGLFSGGYVGVDIFFVISGYLITSLLIAELESGKFSIVNFYERRVRRLFPALFAMVLATGIVGSFLFMPAELEQLAESIVATTLFSSNFLFWQEAGYFDSASHLKPLLHTWSLAVEEQFYIAFPVLLVCINRLFGSRYALATLVVLAVSLLVSVVAVSRWPDAAFYLAPMRAWELMLGSLLATGSVPQVRSRAIRDFVGLVGLALVLYSIFAFDAKTSFPGLSAAVPCVGAALIIYVGINGQSLVTGWLGNRLLVFVGLLSYSLYLWHWPVLVFSKYVLIRDLSAGESATAIVVVFALGYVSWRFIEQPFRRKTTGFSRQRIFGLAAVTMASAGVAGCGLVVSEGLPERLSTETLQFASAKADRHHAGELCWDGSILRLEGGVICSIGEPSATEKSFLVWGDSHAEALAGAVSTVARASGRAGIYAVKHGCIPLFGVYQSHPSRVGFREPCRKFNERISELVSEQRFERGVFIIARWALYHDGVRFKDEPGITVYINDATSKTNSVAENHQVVARGLERTIDLLLEREQATFLVTSVPEIGWDVPTVLARTAFLSRTFDIRPSLEEFRARQRRVGSLLRDASAAPAVELLEPATRLCDGEAGCSVQREGVPLYFDTNHLSRAGVVLVAPFSRRRSPIRCSLLTLE